MRKAKDREDVARIIGHRISIYGCEVRCFAFDAGWVVVETNNGKVFKITVDEIYAPKVTKEGNL